MNKIICLVALFISVIASYGQATLKGKVTNSKGKSLSDVDVLIKGTTKGNSTDNNGVFIINGISKGDYKLEVSMVGYSTKEIVFTITDGENKTLPTIKLKEKSNQLSEVIVSGRRDKTKVPSSSLRLKTELIKVPQNIQVVSDVVMQSQMITNMNDAPFRNVSGASISKRDDYYSGISMRGFSVSSFRNGSNVDSWYGPMTEDMFMVDKMEFVKGPAGFMMSAGDPGGLYNVVTKKPTAKKTGTISTVIGTQDMYRGAVDFGGKIGNDERFLYRVNAMYESSGTHLEHQNPSKRFGFAPAFSYQITPKTKVLIEYSFQKFKTYIGVSEMFNTRDKGFASLDRNFSMIDETFPASDFKEVTLLNKVTHQFNKNWSIEAQYQKINYTLDGAYFYYGELEEDGSLDRYAAKFNFDTEGDYFQTYVNGKFNTGAIKHKIMGGFDFSESRLEELTEYNAEFSTSFNINSPTYFSSPIITFNEDGFLGDDSEIYKNASINRSWYAQDEVSFMDDKVRLTLAGRYTELYTETVFYYQDENQVEKANKFTPRVGLSIDISPQLTAYGLYDQAFLANFVDPKDIKPGTKFDPIEGDSYEVGLKSKLFKDKLRVSLSYYYIIQKNMALPDAEINPATNDPYLFPSERVTSKGFEFDLQGKITNELSLILNYSHNKISDIEGEIIGSDAKHILNGWLTYDFNKNTTLKGFGVSLGYQYQVWAPIVESEMADYFRMDAGITWKNDKLRIGLNINNLLDEYLYNSVDLDEDVATWFSEPGINGGISLTYNLF